MHYRSTAMFRPHGMCTGGCGSCTLSCCSGAWCATQPRSIANIEADAISVCFLSDFLLSGYDDFWVDAASVLGGLPLRRCRVGPQCMGFPCAEAQPGLSTARLCAPLLTPTCRLPLQTQQPCVSSDPLGDMQYVPRSCMCSYKLSRSLG